MGPAVYSLGTLTTLACAVLLLRGFAATRKRLLLWSGLCFIGLTISNVVRFLDLVILTEVDLYLWRLLPAATAMALLLFGLIWDSD
jgi:predicted lysophospholipase L1 biosynthesis ABC-type transport system permease subunit